MDHLSFYEFLLRIHSIAKIGLVYSKDKYALDNYREINDLSKTMLEQFTHVTFDRPNYFPRDVYPTPNVSVRTVIFNEKKQVLMVQETSDGGYSLPGGWADLHESPKEAAIKECLQEAGAQVSIKRLTGIFNRTPKKGNAAIPEYALIFEGVLLGPLGKHDHETQNVGFFSLDRLPTLSQKVTKEEIIRAIQSAMQSGVDCD